MLTRKWDSLSRSLLRLSAAWTLREIWEVTALAGSKEALMDEKRSVWADAILAMAQILHGKGGGEANL